MQLPAIFNVLVATLVLHRFELVLTGCDNAAKGAEAYCAHTIGVVLSSTMQLSDLIPHGCFIPGLPPLIASSRCDQIFKLHNCLESKSVYANCDAEADRIYLELVKQANQICTREIAGHKCLMKPQVSAGVSSCYGVAQNFNISDQSIDIQIDAAIPGPGFPGGMNLPSVFGGPSDEEKCKVAKCVVEAAFGQCPLEGVEGMYDLLQKLNPNHNVDPSACDPLERVRPTVMPESPFSDAGTKTQPVICLKISMALIFLLFHSYF